MDCAFCRIVRGEEPAHVIYQDDDTVAFLDIFPWSEGHALVVPRAHRDDLFDTTPEEAAAVARSVSVVAHLLRRELGVDGVNIVQNNGRAAGQQVFHYHVHLIPRRENDNLFKAPRPGRADDASLAPLAARLRG
ncbi:MAG: HIT family protein [Thermoanaerobaculia bacterium]